jgi:Protein of unknown function DUF2625
VRGDRGREMMMAVIPIRPAEELAEVPDPAWLRWLELVQLAQAPVLVLPAARQTGLDVLFRLQVIAWSMLGAPAVNSGGMLADRGWVRLLGGGGCLLDLATASGVGPPAASAPPLSLTIGSTCPAAGSPSTAAACPASRVRCATGDRTLWHGPR